MKRSQRVITRSDKDHLSSLANGANAGLPDETHRLELFAEELEEAEVLRPGEADANLVTMNARVRVRYVSTGRRTEYQIVFPHEAEVDQGRVSVLAPIGFALLGHRVGDVVECHAPSGVKKIVVEEVLQRSA